MIYDVEVMDRRGGFYTDTTTNKRQRALDRAYELDGKGLFVRVIDRLGNRHQEPRR